MDELRKRDLVIFCVCLKLSPVLLGTVPVCVTAAVLVRGHLDVES